MISPYRFWISTLTYTCITVLSTFIFQAEFYVSENTRFNVYELTFLQKSGFVGLKLFLASAYLKAIKVEWYTIILILIFSLFFRLLHGVYTMGIIGPAIALYLKDSLIHTRNS